MELTITAPGLLFPAISLVMLAHTNRFLALASLIRSLHEKYKSDPDQVHIVHQIDNLRHRIRIIRDMQVFGVVSFIFGTVSILCIIKNWEMAAYITFGSSVLSFVISMLMSLVEITLSLKALEVELSDMEHLSTKRTTNTNIKNG